MLNPIIFSYQGRAGVASVFFLLLDMFKYFFHCDEEQHLNTKLVYSKSLGKLLYLNTYGLNKPYFVAIGTISVCWVLIQRCRVIIL